MQSKPTVFKLGPAVLLLSLVAACSGGGDRSTAPLSAPTVRSSVPLDKAIDVPVNASVRATFSERMDPKTVTVASITLSSGTPAVKVKGTVIYADFTAVFWPSAYLAPDTEYSARITTETKSMAGKALRADHAWSFTTGDTVQPGRTVNLGKAGDFAILASSGISTVPTSAITGDLGLSPAAASFITGFALSLHASNAYATSSQVTGKVYAADYAPPTPTNMTTSVLDMKTAFTDAAARAPGVTELGAGNIGGMTLPPGVYKWGTGLLIPTDVTLSGSATDVWVFQIAQDLTISGATNIVLAGGALPENVFWQVTGLVDIGTTAHLDGIVLCATAITVRTGASVNGRLLAQTAVSIDASTVVEPTK